MGDATQTFTDANFDEKVLQSDKPVLVDFWAPWCGPCRAIAPIVEQIATDEAASLSVGKLDIDDNGVTALKYGVHSIPTLLLFMGGKEVERIVGGMPKDRIMAKVQPHMAASAAG